MVFWTTISLSVPTVHQVPLGINISRLNTLLSSCTDHCVWPIEGDVNLPALEGDRSAEQQPHSSLHPLLLSSSVFKHRLGDPPSPLTTPSTLIVDDTSATPTSTNTSLHLNASQLRLICHPSTCIDAPRNSRGYHRKIQEADSDTDKTRCRRITRSFWRSRISRC